MSTNIVFDSSNIDIKGGASVDLSSQTLNLTTDTYTINSEFTNFNTDARLGISSEKLDISATSTTKFYAGNNSLFDISNNFTITSNTFEINNNTFNLNTNGDISFNTNTGNITFFNSNNTDASFQLLHSDDRYNFMDVAKYLYDLSYDLTSKMNTGNTELSDNIFRLETSYNLLLSGSDISLDSLLEIVNNYTELDTDQAEQIVQLQLSLHDLIFRFNTLVGDPGSELSTSIQNDISFLNV